MIYRPETGKILLLVIAGSVQKGGKSVKQGQIDNAKEQGATDREIHDTILITAAFCMFNRYVDGLNTWAPKDKQVYIDRAPSFYLSTSVIRQPLSVNH